MRALRAGRCTRVGEITLIPLFLVQADCTQQSDFIWLNGKAEPFAVVILAAGGVSALSIDSAELSVERLREKMPDLDAVIKYWWGH